MTWGWMIAKWQWDEATNPGQFWRYPSKGSLGGETKEEKKSEKMSFEVFYLESHKEEGKLEVN
jgi:hypothetical protein